MAKKSIGTKIKLDGEQQFRKAITNCNASLRNMNSEMKLLQQVYKGNEKSTEMLIAKDKLLVQQKEKQIEKIDTLKQALDKAKDTYGENSTKVQQYQKSLLEAQIQLEKTNKEIENNQAQINDMGRVYDEIEKSIQDTVLKLKDAKETYGENSQEVKELEKELNNLKQAQENVSKAIDLDRYNELNDQFTINEDKLSDLRTAYEQTVKTFGETSSEAKSLGEEISELERTQAKLSQEINKTDFAKLSKEYEDNRQEIKRLKDEYKDVVKQFGKNSTEANELKNSINTLEREQKQLKSTLNDTEKSLKETAEALSEVGEQAEKTEEQTSTFKETLKGVLAGNLATKGLEVGFDVVKNTIGSTVETFNDLQEAMNQFSSSTGKSGEELKGYGDIMKEVFADNYGENMEEISNVMAEIVKQTGLQGEELKNVTESAFALSDVFQIDTQESLLAVNTLVNQFGVSSQEAYNLITQGAQKGLNKNGDLCDVISEYSVQYANAGMSAEDFFNSLVNGCEKGAISVDKTGDAFKEMGIRINDGTVTESLKELGINAEGIATSFQKGGEHSKQALSDLGKTLTGIDDDTKRYQAGVAVFGAIWEDMGEEACLALLNTQGEISKTSSAMEDMKNVKYDDIGSALEGLGRVIQVSLIGSLEEKLLPTIQDLITYISTHSDEIAGKVEQVGSVIASAFGWIIDNKELVIGGLIAIGSAMAVFNIINTITAVVQAIQAFAQVTQIATVAQTVFNAVMNANPFVLIATLIAGLVTAIILLWNNCDGFRNACISIWESIKTAFSTAGKAISSVISSIIEWFKNLPSAISSAVNSVIDKIKSFGTSMVEKGKSVGKGFVESFTKFFNNLPKSILTIITSVVGAITKFYATMIKLALKIGKEFLNGILNLLDKLPGGIGKPIKAVIEKVVSFATTMITKAKEIGTNFLKNISNGIKNLPKNISEILSNIIKKVVSFQSNFVSKAKTLASNFKTNFVNVMKTIPSQMLNIGKNIVQGIWDGVSGLGGWLKDKITGFANGIISGFKSALDIHSPSRKTRDIIGKNVVLGIAEGIDKNTKSVTKSTKKMANEIVSSSKVDNKKLENTGTKIAEAIYKGLDKGTKEKPKTAEAISNSLVSQATSKMTALKKVRNVSIKEETAFWSSILSHCKKGSTAYTKALAKLTEAKKRSEQEITKATQNTISKSEKTLDSFKRRHDVSTAEEIAYWKEIRSVCEKGTAEYSQITDKISELNDQLYVERKQILADMEQAEKDYTTNCENRNKQLEQSLTELKQSWQDNINATAESIKSSLGLFEGFESTTEQTVSSLLANMQSQVDATEEYYQVMETLRGRNISSELMEDLEEQGIKDLATLKLIAQMTDEQLAQYQKLYEARNATANKEAKEEVGTEDYQEEKTRLIKEAEEDLATYEQQLKDSQAKLQEQLDLTYSDIDVNLQKKANKMVANFKNSIKKFTDSSRETLGCMGTVTVSETKKKVPACKTVGKNLVQGIASGLRSQTGYLASVASSVVSSAIEAMKSAGDIHSPSRLTKRLIGENLVLGIGEGFNGTMGEVSKSMGDNLSNAITGLAGSADSSLQDIVDSSFSMDLSNVQKANEEAIKKMDFNSPKYSAEANMKVENKTDISNLLAKIEELKETMKKQGENMKNMKITMNDREMGKFVSDTVAKSFS